MTCTVRLEHGPLAVELPCGREGVWNVCGAWACEQPGHVENLLEICEAENPKIAHEVRRRR